MKIIIEKAKLFANKAHSEIDHRRKYSGKPYIVHPEAVAKIVASVTDDYEMICAAWLHDVVEDTPVIIEEIETEFGSNIATLVSELTNVSKPEDGNRKTIKAIDRSHTKRSTPRAKTIKLADCIDNSRSIIVEDPHFAKVYLKEFALLLPFLSEGDLCLYDEAIQIVKEFFEIE
ncbi:MAG: HD domain-containing protein [Balneola sp.]